MNSWSSSRFLAQGFLEGIAEKTGCRIVPNCDVVVLIRADNRVGSGHRYRSEKLPHFFGGRSRQFCAREVHSECDKVSDGGCELLLLL